MQENREKDQIEGRNAVLELLESGRDINKIFITRGEKHGSISKIIAKAKENKVILVEKDKKQMQEMAQTPNYQGVIAMVPPFAYCEIEEIFEEAKQKKEDPFILLLDGIEDPHNLGSIIRTAETAGVHGIIIPERRAASVTATVAKVAAGAIEYMKIARVTNLTDAMNKLKEKGLWICGTDLQTDIDYDKQNYQGPLGIVIGNEGKGISEKVRKNCDFLVKIPMKGKVNSLNAAVATGIIVYEAAKQRK
jgi:23S rRNA (guanosine2251-2'-O)-methyltransferase